MGRVAAQSAPFNEVGVIMGHWHIISKNVEANKKIFPAMGGKLLMPGGARLMMFPGVYINLTLGNEKGDGGTRGSVVNHVGFVVNNVQERVAQWEAAGVAVLPGNSNRIDDRIISNPVYVGEVVHKDTSYPGEHQAIIERALWQRVQGILKESPRKRAAHSRARTPALLKGRDLRPEWRGHDT
jgi:hypothetical protein